MAAADADGREIPLTFEQVLEAEYRFLHPSPQTPTSLSGDPATVRHSALCLSGGGVRSASFNLGVLQGLAQAGVLGTFDYLSTVSGGGYVGGWLTAWRARTRPGLDPDPVAELAAGLDARHGRGPAPVERLRRSIRFLDPHLSLRSMDVWALGTIVLRNLLLTWLVLVPLLAAGALLPRLYLGVLGLPSQPELVSQARLAAWYFNDWLLIVPLFGIAALFSAFELPSLGNRRHGTRAFLLCFLAPVVLGETLMSVHRYWAWRFEGGLALKPAVIGAMIGMALPWFVGGFLSGRHWRPWTWIAAAVAGAAGRTAIWWANHALTDIARDHPQIFVAVDMPITLMLLFGQITLFAGLASRDMTDDDREWLGRAAAWVLIVGVGWLLVGTLVVYAPVLLASTFSAVGISDTAGRLWLCLLALVTSGAASRLGSTWTSISSRSQTIERVAFVAAAPVVVVLLALLLATADLTLLEHVHRLDLFNENVNHPIGASLPEDLLVLGALLAAGLTVSRLVSVNDFSLHGGYRARLSRTFLGASRAPETRRPNPFTGFDDGDDLPFAVTATSSPLHIVNATLNLLADSSLKMQEQRAEPFTMSALHCGSGRVGYRPSVEYGGGMSLAQAITVSGAAVSPNMGALSKPALTFLLTLFNARLGAWMANPGPAGRDVWRNPRLSYGAAPLLKEMLGQTTDRDPYVYLSDGGHFENLGLYEMVRRRCHFIVVSDAACDPTYRFDDLANAIRKVRLDFGVEIDFPGGLDIAGPTAVCRGRIAVGRIAYSALDAAASDGVLLYLKAALCGDEPVDVANYAAAHPLFPHQPTSNQWFEEAQFESYRRLGAFTVAAITRGEQAASLDALCARAKELIGSKSSQGSQGARSTGSTAFTAPSVTVPNTQNQ